MSNTLTDLRRQIKNTDSLRSVVKTMKAMAASSINPFQQAVTALVDYRQTIEQALFVCLRSTGDRTADFTPDVSESKSARPPGYLVFGTDQGMVGQFNEQLAEDVIQRIHLETAPATIWTVGERIQDLLQNVGLTVTRVFQTPSSVGAITHLVTEILLEIECLKARYEIGDIYQSHNRFTTEGSYDHQHTRLLPLDQQWRKKLVGESWPTKYLPEMIDSDTDNFPTLIRAHLFTSVYQACAESCAAENAARLASMQRAEKNIEDRRRLLDLDYNQQRQTTIDEELFDLVSGFEALTNHKGSE